uniref:E3 ubiquitin protein ligase n=1 Tax=Chaetoceros debilis TaxID=122233 RepID=A0A7S3V5V2_9STRA|mmetsp:Transcript_4328/g.6075  ORF Transcript_4328/g.6075 Transcript_4328/m.6075 type:complete len:1012 (+) Transcript_4328:282-3317(+)
MKRALAERAKQQTDEQHKHRAAAPPIGLPARSASLSVVGNKSNSLAEPIPKSAHAPATSGTRNRSDDHLAPPRKVPKSHSSSTPAKLKNNMAGSSNISSSKKKTAAFTSGAASSASASANSSANAGTTAMKTLSSASLMKIKAPGRSSSSKKRVRPSHSSPSPKSSGSGTSSSAAKSDHHRQVGNEDDDENNQSAFFLRRQNQALASELYQYKHTITLLERERDVRRKECHHIGEALGKLECIWLRVERGIAHAVDANEHSFKENALSTTGSGMKVSAASTGNGGDVETILSITQSIVRLAKSPYEEFRGVKGKSSHQAQTHASLPQDVSSNENVMDVDQEDGALEAVNDVKQSEEEQSFLNALSSSTTSFSNRCSKFQELLIRMLNGMGKDLASSTTSSEVEKLHEQLLSLQASCNGLECQVQELVKAREEACLCERKVRRGLYRVASGRLKIGEVLKAVEKEGSSSLDDLEEIQNELSAPKPTRQGGVAHGDSANGEGKLDAVMFDGKMISCDDVVQMKKLIDDLKIVNESRHKRITELLDERVSQDKKINDLMAQEKSGGENNEESNIQASPLYIEMTSKLTSAEREVKMVKKEMEAIKQRWAQCKGDLELAHKSIADLKEKHNRRFLELSGNKDEGGKAGSTISPNGNGCIRHIEQAKHVIELEHKLKHALDNVRQSESIRISLIDAHSMNEMLQRQIGEIKVKQENLELIQGGEGNTGNSHGLNPARDEGEKDRLYSRMKKEMSSALNKVEQAEKERDSLVSMNLRLQQQSVEKDDMNAKSLSTILHLKQLSEQLEQEKDAIEKNLKSAQQLAVGARLASNAKARVEEEAMREKEAAVSESKECKLSLETLQKEKERVQGELAMKNAKLESAKSESEEIRNRCDELVSKTAIIEEEKRKLEEALIIAKKDAIEVSKKASKAQIQARGTNSKFDTEFTSEELTIQVNQLKNRLVCPVCMTRDKRVIITRCRHMFCRHCIAANLEARNRKCPSCKQRFEKKDVEDVWF